MIKKLTIGVPSLILLHSFTLFTEYFVGVSGIYILILTTLIIYNIYGLFIQKSLSECIFLILLMVCYLIVNDDLITINYTTFNHSFNNDYFSSFTKFLICFFSAIYFLFISNYLKEQKITSPEYLIIILFSILGLILLCSSNDLLTAYLSIELSSLALYILAAFKKTSNYSVESGIKYFITGAVSSAFFLLGSSFIYGTMGSINFSNFVELIEGLTLNNNNLILGTHIIPFSYLEYYLNLYYIDEQMFNYNFAELGLTLILFSLYIKLALAPFHFWSLDVYEGSPTSSTFFFAVITKLSIFVLLYRLCYTSFYTLKDCWQFYSLWVGVFSIFIGSFGGLKQRKLKTLLAYSSISHMGYVVISFSTGTLIGVQMLLFYMIIYMISNLCIWFVILNTKLKKKIFIDKYNKELSDFALLKKSNKTLAFSLSLTMFSIAGIPPLLGFIAKMYVFLSTIGISFYFVSLLGILFSVVSTFYYIRIIKTLYFENILIGKLYHPISSVKTVIFSFLIFSLLLLFVNPTTLYIFTYKLIL
jgi:NADH-quinone oxidoreductase subunit N